MSRVPTIPIALPTTTAELSDYHELCFYTLAHPDPAFIHQHTVDAFAAQNADTATKPITVAFALAGLYLTVEKGLSGREVQRTHSQLANTRRPWPAFEPPANRGAIRVSHVLQAPPGAARDQAIRDWCRSVWDAWKIHRDPVRALLSDAGLEPD